MLANYFTLALRNIQKRKLLAGINILGMAAGIAAVLLIALYIFDEYSYDQFHTHANRLYQVGLHRRIGDHDVRSASTCPPLADALRTEIPEVESTLRMSPWLKLDLVYSDKAFAEDKVFFTEGNFFDFFSFKLVSGDPSTALKEPNSVVLGERTARKLFGDENPLDKLIVIDQGDKVTYKVTGVAANPPGNSHFRFNVLLSAEPYHYFDEDAWLNSGVYTYLMVREGASVKDVEQKMQGLVKKYVAPALANFLGNDINKFQAGGGVYSYYTTRITDIHLKSTSRDDIEPGGSLRFMAVIGSIGIFILLIACVNFMNMSTAQSAGRAKEVGLRKTLGSRRVQMIGQFLIESMLYSFVAVVLAVVLCFLVLPAFNLLSGKELSLGVLFDVRFMSGAGVVLVMVGLLAGSYPAFYLTSFRPVEVLKGNVTTGRDSHGIRRILVVFQFATSIFLIIVTCVVYSQIRFMQAKQLGIDKNQVLLIEDVYKLGNNGAAFRESVAQLSGVSKVSFTAVKFPGTYMSTVTRAAQKEGDHVVANYYADFDSQDVLKFEMKAGRYFSRAFPSDTAAVVLNETAAKELGFDRPEGNEILYSPNAYVFVRRHVVGIMKDFNFDSYRNKVRPLAVFLDPGPSPILMVRYEGSPQQLVDQTSQLWRQFAGTVPFAYSFMDENFDRVYRTEARIGQLLAVFAGLAIGIACLGLFALATFTAEQRTREIGIRKVLGATVGSISMMLTREFVVLVLIAFVPAAAAGWWVSEQWLNGFAYRVNISLFIFIGACTAAVVIAWLTVGFRAFKAARANPVDSLRHV